MAGGNAEIEGGAKSGRLRYDEGAFAKRRDVAADALGKAWGLVALVLEPQRRGCRGTGVDAREVRDRSRCG